MQANDFNSLNREQIIEVPACPSKWFRKSRGKNKTVNMDIRRLSKEENSQGKAMNSEKEKEMTV